jgi:hypothetical protein
MPKANKKPLYTMVSAREYMPDDPFAEHYKKYCRPVARGDYEATALTYAACRKKWVDSNSPQIIVDFEDITIACKLHYPKIIKTSKNVYLNNTIT